MIRYLALIVVSRALVGCAVGRNESTGAIVLGVDAGKLVETPGQALSVAGQWMPEPYKSLATGAGALLLGGGTIGTMAARSRRRENDTWDEARKDGQMSVMVPPPAPPPAPIARLP